MSDTKSNPMPDFRTGTPAEWQRWRETARFTHVANEAQARAETLAGREQLRARTAQEIEAWRTKNPDLARNDLVEQTRRRVVRDVSADTGARDASRRAQEQARAAGQDRGHSR